MKKRSLLIAFLSLILTFSVSIGLTTSIAYAEETPVEYSMGDANLDGKVNTRDAVYIKQSVVGLVELTERQKIFSDVNGDGNINTRDAVLIQQSIVGMDIDLGVHEHSFENGVCICGYVEPHTHNYSELKFDVDSHWYECSCGDKDGLEEHHGGNATCTEKAVCDDCGIEYGSKKSHSYTILKQSATQHWWECSCGAYETKDNHNPGAEATETTDQKCTECNYVIAPALGHVHTLHLTKVGAKPQSCTATGNIEYYTCSCGKWFTADTAETEITDKTSVVIAKDNHKHNILKHNETEHWYECTCGDRATAEGHKGGTATETQRPVCSECGVEYGDFLVELDYEINNDGTYRIIGIGSCEKKEVVIPSSIKGIQVTEIADNAFEGQSQIIALILPETIKHIGTRAFYNCTGLKQFTIPSSVETFGTQIFYKTSIETIYYNNDNSCSENLSLSHIKTVVFGGTKIPKEIKCNVPEIKILDSVAIIEDSAFKSCNAIKKVITGKGLIKIGRHAFALCESLTSLVLCGGALTIEEEAFFGCTALTEINFNVSRCFDFSNNNYIFGKAGIEGSGIKVIIGTDVFRVPANLFYPGSQNAYGSYEAKIKEVVFEEGSICKSIGYSAFKYCNEIESLKLSNNISTIESYAFLGCTSLKIVQLSEKLTNIGNYAFNGCSLEYIKIPDMVTRIEDSAFRGCSFLKEIEIADSVVYIGDNAFLKCESIEKIYYKGDETGWNYISVGNNNEQISMVKVLYYIENQEDVPTDGGNYWHYDENGNPAMWG